jgi:hypothetical protein
MPKLPTDMSDEAVKRRAKITAISKAKPPEEPPAPKPRIAKKR